MRNTAIEGEAECSTVVKIVNESKKSKQCKVLATGILRYTVCILQRNILILSLVGGNSCTSFFCICYPIYIYIIIIIIIIIILKGV